LFGSGNSTTNGTTYELGGLEVGTELSITVIANPATDTTEDQEVVPTFLTVANVTSSTITITWEMVPCLFRNGKVIGYVVRYGKVGSLERTLFHVQGGDTNETTLSNLIAATLYSIEVAGVNSFSIINFLEPGIQQSTLEASSAFPNMTVATTALSDSTTATSVPSDSVVTRTTATVATTDRSPGKYNQL
jgi:hypothetical protein